MKRALIGAVVGLLLVVGALIVIWLLVGATLENLRDIVIVAIGLALFVLLLSLIGVAFGLIAVVGLLRERLPALLDQGRSALENVRGTSGFVSERVASPFIKVTAAAAGARAAAQAFVRRNNDGK